MSYRLLDLFSMSYRPHIEASCKVLKKTVEVFDVPILRDVVTEYIIYGFNKREEIVILNSNLVPRPSPAPVFGRLHQM